MRNLLLLMLAATIAVPIGVGAAAYSPTVEHAPPKIEKQCVFEAVPINHLYVIEPVTLSYDVAVLETTQEQVVTEAIQTVAHLSYTMPEVSYNYIGDNHLALPTKDRNADLPTHFKAPHFRV